jgi:ABC-type uncharacterized transport system fused permease/ATPase subunit
MNAILGGLFSSRLNLNLREVHAYTYGAHSAFDWRRAASPFEISTAVETAVTADALREISLEFTRIREAPVSDAELSLATSYLVGVFPIILAIPKYLSGEMSLGSVMQLATAFVQVQMALNWIVDNFVRFAELRASANRVGELVFAMDGMTEAETQREAASGAAAVASSPTAST